MCINSLNWFAFPHTPRKGLARKIIRNRNMSTLFIILPTCDCQTQLTHHVHSKFRNINPRNITHSLISRNLNEWIFVIQILLLIVTFLSLISQILSLMQTTKEVNPHPHIVPCVNMWTATFLFLFLFFFLGHLLNVGACVCYIAREGQVEWAYDQGEPAASYK